MKVVMVYDFPKASGPICITVVVFKNYELPDSHIAAVVFDRIGRLFDK